MKATPSKSSAAHKKSAHTRASVASPTGSGSTSSGPSHPASPKSDLPAHAADPEALASAMPFNKIKGAEHGYDHAVAPASGACNELPSPTAGASTLSEKNASSKTGAAALTPMSLSGSLMHGRINSTDQALTTNQGVAVSDNQNSLKAGLRGPTLLEDFVLREKITHFDHERIPERVVHARGSGAHGFFECYKPLTKYTKATPFAEDDRPAL